MCYTIYAMEYGLIIPAFIAGFFTFFAPCTLPLVPGFLAFISGTTSDELHEHTAAGRAARWRVFWNGVWYVLGFSSIFIILGVLFGLGGSALVQYRLILSQIGGVFVIIFGLYLLGASQWKVFSFLNSEKRFHPANVLTPGKPTSSFIFGATFAFGWTPCVGPILGSVLLLASTSGTVGQGAILLAIFSLGLALPFLVMAAMIGSAGRYIKVLNKWLPVISKVGGVFLLFLGYLLLTDQLGVWTGQAFQWLQIINYDKLYEFL